MERMKGFQHTEVGFIHDDWTVVKLGDCLLQPPKYGINAPAVKFSEGLPAYIRITDISEDGYFSPENLVSVDNRDADRYYLHEGDIVFARTGASVGKSYLYRKEDGPLVFAGFLIRVSTNSSKIDPGYLSQFVKTKIYWNWVTTMSMRSGQPGINGNEYAQLKIPIPPTIEEQRTIAAALSDVDDLLTSLDTLIAKKRLIKQGAMQELLTGRRRLPGFMQNDGFRKSEGGLFPKDWEKATLSEISLIHGRIGWQGLKQTEFTMNSEEPFLITGMNFKDGEIRWEEVYHVPWARYEIAKEIQLIQGDVLMTKDGTIGKILYVDNIPYPGKATLNSHLLVFRPKNNQKFVPKFLYYQLNYKNFHEFIEKEKSGTTFFGITQEAVSRFVTFLPSIPEQKAISEVLTNLDIEITTLEQRLEKTRLLKQGMMQELLTGRIRLV